MPTRSATRSKTKAATPDSNPPVERTASPVIHLGLSAYAGSIVRTTIEGYIWYMGGPSGLDGREHAVLTDILEQLPKSKAKTTATKTAVKRAPRRQGKK